MLQPYRTRTATGRTILALAIAASVTAGKNAYSGTVPQSYQANGSCFCTQTTATSESANTLMPTPVGGQTIAQICARVGTGPGLILDNGEFNHQAYSDAQCGNGPGAEPLANNSDTSCTGINGRGEDICGDTGPKWDLVSAYAKPVVTATPELVVQQPVSTPQSISAPTENLIIHQPVKVEPVQIADVQIQGSKDQTITTTSIQSVADQLRVFNDSVTNSATTTVTEVVQPTKVTAATVALQTAKPVIQTTEPVAQTTAEPITLVESSYRAEPVKLPAAEQVDLAQSYSIKKGDNYSYEDSRAIYSGQLASAVITNAVVTPDTNTQGLTQEEILLLPELETHRAPVMVTRKTGDITITTDDSQLKGRQIIIIEEDGTARRMSQSEIDRLPLADDSEIKGIDGAIATQSIPASEPSLGAAVATPDVTQVQPELQTQTSRKGWRSRLDYEYIGLAPTGYDFGGVGMELEASATNSQGLALIGSAGVAEEYSEASLAVGLYFAPFPHPNTDVVLKAGVETGLFDLGITELEDTGGFFGGYIRTRPIQRLELTGGGRYSSYFEGDAVFIASGTFSITQRFNAFSKVEVGDNDQFSFGFRYFY